MGPGLATLGAQRMRSVYLKMLNEQVLPLMENFFPDDNIRQESCDIAETCGNNVGVNVSVNKANKILACVTLFW